MGVRSYAAATVAPLVFKIMMIAGITLLIYIMYLKIEKLIDQQQKRKMNRENSYDSYDEFQTAEINDFGGYPMIID